jgi:hypothetical protein
MHTCLVVGRSTYVTRGPSGPRYILGAVVVTSRLLGAGPWIASLENAIWKVRRRIVFGMGKWASFEEKMGSKSPFRATLPYEFMITRHFVCSEYMYSWELASNFNCLILGEVLQMKVFYATWSS